MKWNEIAADVQLKSKTKQFDGLLKKDYILAGDKTDVIDKSLLII